MRPPEAGARGRPLAALLALSATLLPTAQAARLSIGSVQSIAPTQSKPATPPGQANRPGARELAFDAYGRRFTLKLATNPRIAGGADLEVLEGELVGHAGSWVRLTRYEEGWHGVIFDGADYYGVESAARSAGANESAARLPRTATVIYRWREVMVDNASFDGDVRRAPQTLAALAASVEGEIPIALPATSPVTRQLEVGLAVDAEEVTRQGSESSAIAAAKSRLNVADGILSGQTGIRLHAVDVVASIPASQSGFGTTDADALLSALKDWRKVDASQNATGITHLFTGKEIVQGGNAQTVGIAYLESACKGTYASSLSEARQTADFDGLVAAHEIAHTLGAPHDAETGSACASTPAGYLMGTTLTSQATQLSDCSLEKIRTYTSSASCLVPVDVADVAVGAPATATIAVNQNSRLDFTVRNGNVAATGVTFTLTLPAHVNLVGVASSGACGADASLVRCPVGDLAPGETRGFQVTVNADQAGDSQAYAEVSAASDAAPGNNATAVRLTATQGADLSAVVSIDPASIAQGASTSAQVKLQNLGLGSVTDAQVTITVGAGLVPQSVTGTGVSCTLASGAISCTPASLPAGATASLQLQLQAGASASGVQQVTASVKSAAIVDPVPANNQDSKTVTIAAPAPAPQPPPPTTPAPTGGGGGGGGQLDALLLAVLALTAATRLRRGARRGLAAVFLALLAAGGAAKSEAEQLPLWELGLGVGALGFSDYRGADSSHVYPLPVPYLVYRGRYLQADREGVRGLLLDRPRVTLGISANATTPVNSDGIAARAGMPDLHPTVELGPSLDLHLWRSADTRRLLDLRLPVRATITAEADPRFIGWQFAPRVNLDVRDPLGLTGWNLGALVGPLFAQRRYHDYFYSVAPDFATQARPAYAAPGGYAGAQLLLSASRRFERGWFGAFARYDRLDGASFIDSPLVRRHDAWMAGFGYAWILGSSARLVDVGG